MTNGPMDGLTWVGARDICVSKKILGDLVNMERCFWEKLMALKVFEVLWNIGNRMVIHINFGEID